MTEQQLAATQADHAITTEELVAFLSQSIRKRYCESGTCSSRRPVKLPSGRVTGPDSQSHEPEQLSLLLPEPLNPAWPNAGTLAAEVLARLLTGERLTQLAFGTSRWRLAAYIMTLKYLGWPVKSARVHYPGRTRPIAQYWLGSEIIRAVMTQRPTGYTRPN
ncbi:hypothetical protein PSAB6_460048 [Paraburkholderia sabiae]|uniref:hypothetical protein n=1 Tax=Paraburkholderia sabiae TaxID=273251 RepID=UPI001CB46CA6|nr:hypothetical protein [Paraburkholderia sabiae]CAG9226379.1 hypothetical protein PSAB6_460048 [Paraburkholderia sabiae]